MTSPFCREHISGFKNIFIIQGQGTCLFAHMPRLCRSFFKVVLAAKSREKTVGIVTRPRLRGILVQLPEGASDLHPKGP